MITLDYQIVIYQLDSFSYYTMFVFDAIPPHVCYGPGLGYDTAMLNNYFTACLSGPIFLNHCSCLCVQLGFISCQK